MKKTENQPIASKMLVPIFALLLILPISSFSTEVYTKNPNSQVKESSEFISEASPLEEKSVVKELIEKDPVIDLAEKKEDKVSLIKESVETTENISVDNVETPRSSSVTSTSSVGGSCSQPQTPHLILCEGDLNRDRMINQADVRIILAHWRTANDEGPVIGRYDLNQDGFTDGADLGIVLGHWGSCLPAQETISPDMCEDSGNVNIDDNATPDVSDENIDNSADTSKASQGAGVVLPTQFPSKAEHNGNSTDSDDNNNNNDGNGEENTGGNSNHSGGGSHGGSSVANLVGEVLGASTESICTNPSDSLQEYVKYGANNNPNEVKKLQTFLNKFQGANLPITGYYGPATMQAVKDFQLMHSMFILKPWADAGFLANDKTATGYVYKTTKRWINLIDCPGASIPMPSLI